MLLQRTRSLQNTQEAMGMSLSLLSMADSFVSYERIFKGVGVAFHAIPVMGIRFVEYSAPERHIPV